MPSTTPFAAPKSPALCHKAARSSPVCCLTPSSRHTPPALSFARRVLPALPGGQQGQGPKICGIKACLLLNYTAVCPEPRAKRKPQHRLCVHPSERDPAARTEAISPLPSPPHLKPDMRMQIRYLPQRGRNRHVGRASGGSAGMNRKAPRFLTAPGARSD